MNKINKVVSVALLVSFFSCSPQSGNVKIEKGPLRVSKVNPRYFTDNTGKAVYLTGSHTWDNLVDMGPTDPPEKFDYKNYISFLKKYGHNFTRLWAWELLRWDTKTNKNRPPHNHYVYPHPYERTGPGLALDGKPKFDLTRLNPEYFDRLRERVSIAADSGIYVSVMLFEGWGNQFIKNSFESDPFNPANNINNIDVDLNKDSVALEIHQLAIPEITNIQKEYIKKVIHTVNEFDNVIYEIGNEIHVSSTDWQYEMIRFVKEYEKNMPKQHPVGMTYQHKMGINQTLWDSPADWISPNNDPGSYDKNPEPSDGSKVVLSDTDHLWGIGGNAQWAWKSFMRGLNPIFMDPYESKILSFTKPDTSWVEPLRKAMGHTEKIAKEIDLINMVPDTVLSSTKYCLANNGAEYLVYLPDTVVVLIDLVQGTGLFEVEWIDSADLDVIQGKNVSGGGVVTLTSPFGSPGSLVHLKEVNEK
jgi:hypothetical protein